MDSGQPTFAALLAGTLARWRQATAVAAGTVVLAVALTFLVPPSYRATASFVTTEASGELPRGLSDLANQPGLSNIASQLGVGGSRDPSQSPAFYVQLLQSRELLTRLVGSKFADPHSRQPGDSATLVQLFRIRTTDAQRGVEVAVKRLKKQMYVIADPKTNLVVLRVDARSPELAAEIGNRAVGLVSAFNKEQRLSRAQARRVFLQDRVDAALAELRAAEDSQRVFYDRNRQWQNSPGLVIGERRMRRQVETASDLYLAMRREFETARLDEINNTPVITIVDRAVAPRRPEWPQRTLITVTAAVLGVALGLMWAAAYELVARWGARNPGEADALRRTVARVTSELRTVLRLRRRAG
ncbi:MAG: GNVR domain-containing protein [Gemmatimonadales bacterium]